MQGKARKIDQMKQQNKSVLQRTPKQTKKLKEKEKYKGRKMEKNSALSDTLKKANIKVIGIPEEESWKPKMYLKKQWRRTCQT